MQSLVVGIQFLVEVGTNAQHFVSYPSVTYNNTKDGTSIGSQVAKAGKEARNKT